MVEILTDNEKVYAVMLRNGLALIGRISKSHGTMSLRRPCMVVTSPGPGNSAQVELRSITGNPEDTPINSAEVVLGPYLVTEKALINAYIQCTSGIQIANLVPIRGTNNN